MINHLKGLEINSIYDFDNSFSINELLCKFWEKIEETINISNESIDILNWIKEQALSDEVQLVINQLVADGTIEQMINIDKINEVRTLVNTQYAEMLVKHNDEVLALNNRVDGIENTLSNDVQTFKEEIQEQVDNMEIAFENVLNTEITELENNFESLSNSIDTKLSNIKYVENQSELKTALVDNSIIYITNSIALTEVMKLPSNCRIIGKGDVTLTTNQNAIFVSGKINVTEYNGTNNVIIDGITFDGQNKDTQPLTLIGIGHSKNITITNCTFKNLHIWHMIEINGSKDIIVNNCRFENYGLSGTQCTEAVQIDSMKDNTVYPWGGTYDNTACENVTIENCIFVNIGNSNNNGSDNVKAIGNHTFQTGVLHDKIKIIGNTFTNVTWAIYLRDCNNVMVHNNISRNTHCLFRTETVNNKLSDFIITNNHHIGKGTGSYDSMLDGRFVMIQHAGNTDSHTVDNVTIANNNIYNVTGHAIGLTANYVKISNNFIYNYGRNGIYLYGGNNGSIYGNTLTPAKTNYYGIKLGGNPDNGTKLMVVSNNVSSIKIDNNNTKLLVVNNIGDIDNSGSATLYNNI